MRRGDTHRDRFFLMAAVELYQRFGEQLFRRLLLGPYDFERKLEGGRLPEPVRARRLVAHSPTVGPPAHSAREGDLPPLGRRR